MRIRYGKSIKVQSLLGKQDIFSTISSIGGGYSYGAKLDGSFLGGWNDALRQNVNSKWINLTANHKYLCYVGLNATNIYRNVYNGVVFLTSDSILRGNADDNPFGLGYSVTCITPSSNISVVPVIQNYHDYWTIGDVIKEMVVLDLTDIYGSGNELTATQFYNKYNKYFPLIATGEEITIDDKAGQIKNVKSSLDDYIELEYIESTGTQYINTGLTSKGRGITTVELKVSPSQTNIDRAFFGEYSNSVIELGQLGSKWRTNVSGTATNLIVNEARVWSVSTGGGWYVDGVRSGSDLIGTGESSVTMRLFGRFYNGSMDKNASCKIYYCKIWESGVLKRDFIPVIKKSDNTIGMLDKVNNVFYTNQGTGTFITGPAKELPSEYQEVEYIYQEKQNSSGLTNLAFIQSNLSFADIDAVEFDLAIATDGGAQNNIVLCAYNTSYYIIVDKNTHRVNGFSSSSWEPTSTTLFSDELRHKVKVSGLSSSNTTKIRTAWDWTWWHKTKWYGLKLYKNNVLIQNLIPCYRKSDNVIGMYDVIENIFFANAGQGTFLKGNNIPHVKDYKPVAYIEGTTNLVTSLKAGGRTSIVNNTVVTNGQNGDTYFYLNFSAALVQGTTYTISCDAEIPEGGTGGTQWKFGLGSQSTADPNFIIKNGHNTYTFVCTANSAKATLLFDDMQRIYNVSSVFKNFQVEQKDHATPYTPNTRNDMII